MINIVFDATVLTGMLRKNAARSGIFFAAYNVFVEMMNRKDLNILLYCSSRHYLDFKTFQRLYCPNIRDAYKPGVAHSLFKFYLFLEEFHKKIFRHILFRKIFALGMLATRALIRVLAPLSIDFNQINSCDVFFSPVFGIPPKVGKNVLKSIFLYDAIPLKFPQYYPKGSFLNTIKKGGSEIDLFFFDSFSAYNDFRSFFSFVTPYNSKVAHLAANSSFFCNKDLNRLIEVKNKYNIPQNKKFVFSLCTLEPRKNLICSLKSFLSFVKKNKIDDMVWVLGGGHWESFIKKFRAEVENFDDWNSIITRIGYVDDEDLSVLYSNAIWFVYASQYEGFGLPPLEAMQCGCPVITSNNSSLPEVVGDSGIMIDWDSEEQHIVAYEKYYFDDSFRRECSIKGLERAKLFSWTKTVDVIVSELENKQNVKKGLPIP